MSTITTDVLVVGAGPAGLTTAVSAARHGAQVLLVERRPQLSPHPRATGVSTRSMEIFYSWGIAPAIRAGAVDAEARMAIMTGHVATALRAGRASWSAMPPTARRRWVAPA